MATKILFVDDNPDTLVYIAFMLKRRGYEVMTSPNGQDALQKARENPPDLFLVDVLMPGMDGYQLTRAIRNDPRLRNLPVIIFSAATSPENKARGFEAGADDYLTKPILTDELDNRIRAAIQLPRTHRLAVMQVEEKPAVTHHGRVIGFWGCKGGVGVTTLLVNTGLALAQDAQVIIGDLNVGLGSIVLQLGLKVSAAPRSPWTMRPEEITPHIVRDALLPYSDALRVLLVSEGERWSPTVPFVETVLGHLRSLADFVLLDLGAGVTADKFPLLICCDHVVLISGADRIASALTEYALEAAANLNITRERASVVMVQRRDSTGMLTPEILERHLRIKLDAVIPIARTDALWTSERGAPVVSALPQSSLAQSYVRFAQKLAGLGN